LISYDNGEFAEDAYVELPEYAATNESSPPGSAVVTHWASLDEIVTDPQDAIETPPTSKSTEPVAPDVTVAVSVTGLPKLDDVVGETLNDVVDGVPGTTGMSGDDRRLYCE
jgi:hypothetical protein